MLLSRLTILLCLLVSSSQAAPASELGARGYAVLPQPQRTTLTSADFRFGPTWGLQHTGVAADDIAVTSFREGISSRFHIASLRPEQSGGTITLALAPGSVTIGDALDSDKEALAQQAYQIDLAPTAITITANAAPGLYYGVQTLLQLIKPR